MEEANVNVVAG